MNLNYLNIILLMVFSYSLSTGLAKKSNRPNRKFSTKNKVNDDVKDSILIFNVTSGEFKYTLTGHRDSVLSFVKLENNFLASGSADSTIKIWDITNMGHLNRTLIGHKDSVSSLIYLDNNLLASGSKDGFVFIWNGITGDILFKIQQESNNVNTRKN